MSKIFACLGRNLLNTARSNSLTYHPANLSSIYYSKFSTAILSTQNGAAIGHMSNSNPFRNHQQHRTLFSPANLDIDKLDQIRANTKKVFETGATRYIERISEYLETGDTKAIFRDDLINLIGLAEKENLDLVDRFIRTAMLDVEQSFSGWCVSVMRLYYKFNEVDRAYNNIKDESFGTFFDQRKAHQILLCMLYEAGRYQDVIEIYELVKNRCQENNRYKSDRRLTVTVFAACAKLNTPESQQIAAKLYAEDDMNPNLKTRSVSIVAYLSVLQDKVNYALNLISDLPGKQYVLPREIKTMALLKLGRYEDVLVHLRQSFSEVQNMQGIKGILQENIDAIEAILGDVDDVVKSELTLLVEEFKTSKLVDPQTIEDLLFQQILPRRSTLNDSGMNTGYRRQDGRMGHEGQFRQRFSGESRDGYRQGGEWNQRRRSDNYSEGGEGRRRHYNQQQPKSYLKMDEEM